MKRTASSECFDISWRHIVPRGEMQSAFLTEIEIAELGRADAGRVLQHGVEDGLQLARRARNYAQHLRRRRLLLQRLGKVPPHLGELTSARSELLFNSISELGPLLTPALAFVPVERSLRPRVGLFAPLRDKVTSSAQALVFPSARQGPHSTTSSARPTKGSGTVSPRALATFRLMTSLYLSAC